MAPETLPSIETLRLAFIYDPVTGILRWRTKKNPHRNAGRAGSELPRGYRHVSFRGRFLMEHRLIWCLVTGEWPVAQIDHRDGDPSNNRWDNLREATSTQNNCNRRHDGQTPCKGVNFVCRLNKWQARIQVNRQQIYLGVFEDMAEAVKARREAEKHLHGEFVRL